MKIHISRIGLLILGMSLACLVFAQGPNFTGTWALDKDKSDAPQGFGGRGGGGGQGPAMSMDITLVIQQTETDLVINRQAGERSSESKHTLDGKENVNQAPAGRGGTAEVRSKTKWNKDKLVTEGVRVMNFQGQEFEIHTKEERTLSADGKVMTIVTTTSTPQGERTMKQVFNKQ